MNHGGIAYLSEDQIIRLSEDLLRPLSVAEGSQLTAIYYPTPQGPEYEEDYRSVPPQADFMLTPIPYRAWPYSAGMRVDIQHQKGAFADVTAYLRSHKINIIMAQCTRSGHRHATWTLAVEFEGLRKNDELLPGLEELDLLSEQLRAKTKALEKEIGRACRSAIPDPATTPYPRNPIGCWPLKGLAYFFKYSRNNDLSRPFRAVCSRKDAIDVSDAHSAVWSAVREDFPTLGFASLDTDLFNIRIAVLSREGLKRFRSVSIQYRMDTFPHRSSLGLLNSMAQKLRADWNLWRVYNQIQKSTSTREEGTVQIFAEYSPGGQALREGEIEKDLKEKVKSVSSDFKDFSVVEPVRTSRISPRRIFVSMKNASEFSRHEDVLRICRDLSRKIGVLPEDVITVKTYTAESVTSEVIERVKSCSGMLQFLFMDGASSMEWLSGEFFLACFLGMPCVRFVDPVLQNQVTFQKDHPAKVLRMDVSELELSRAIEEALEELDRRMPW